MRKSEEFLEAFENMLAAVPLRDEVEVTGGMTKPEDPLSPNFWRVLARQWAMDILASVQARDPNA